MEIVIEKRIFKNRINTREDGTKFNTTCYFINITDNGRILKKVLFTPVNNNDYSSLDLVAHKVFDDSIKNTKKNSNNFKFGDEDDVPFK